MSDNFDPLGILKKSGTGGDPLGILTNGKSTADYFNTGLTPEQIHKKNKQETPKNDNDQFLSIGEPVIPKQNGKGVVPILTTQQPNIKEAIERTVDKKVKDNRGVYDKTLPAPTDEEKDIERRGVLQAYKRGDLVPAKNSKGESVLKRGTGFLESFNDASTEHYNQGLKDSYVLGLPRDKAIEHLNLTMKYPDEDRQSAPSGALGETGEFLGENTELLLKGTVGTMAGIASTLTGGASFGTFLAMSKDLANSGYSQTLQNNYNKLKEQNTEISDDDAYDAANKAALVGEAVSLGTGALLSHSVAPKIPKPRVPVKGVTDGISQSLTHAILTSPKVIGSASAGSVINDITSKVLGVDVSLEEVGEHAFDAAKQMGVMHFGLWALTEPYRVPSYLRPQLENVVASAPREEVKEFYQAMEENGGLPQGTTEKVLTDLQKFDEAKSKIPEKLSEEKKAAMAGLINQRSNLEQDYAKNISEKDPLFHDGIREDFEKSHEAVNKKIEKIYRSDNPFDHEVDSLTGEKPKNVLAEPENVIPDETQKETEKPIEQTVEGSIADNGNVKTEESSTSKEVIGETIRAAGEGEIKVGELIDKPITYDGKKATLYQDGQTVVAKIEGENKEYEIGNIDEIRNKSISDFNIEHETSVVGINDNGNISVRSEEYKNNYSDPLAAINHDENGNIVSVNLETVGGKKRTFRGNIAEDIAYQIHLKEITKNNETRNEFEQFINTDEPTSKEINDAGISETTPKKSTENNAKIQRTKAKKSEPKIENKPTEVKHPEIIKLEKERDSKIKEGIKGNTKIELIPAKKLVDAKDPIEAKSKHDKIKEDYKTLKKLIDCL